MKKGIFVILILAVICMVALGVTIYTKNVKITEYGEETYYVYEEVELGTELNPSSESYTPIENVAYVNTFQSSGAERNPWESVEPTAVNPDELADIFGISISLPENPTWIVDSEYHLTDKNHLEITYHDSIADTDCVILVAKDKALTLPKNEYDERLNETWEGRTITDQNILINVQHGKNDSKTVLATWEYNEYRFAIIGEIEGDSGPIAKVALSIIYDLN